MARVRRLTRVGQKERWKSLKLGAVGARLKQNSEQDLTQNENVRAVHLFLNFTEFEIAQNVLVMFMMAMGALHAVPAT